MCMHVIYIYTCQNYMCIYIYTYNCVQGMYVYIHIYIYKCFESQNIRLWRKMIALMCIYVCVSICVYIQQNISFVMKAIKSVNTMDIYIYSFQNHSLIKLNTYICVYIYICIYINIDIYRYISMWIRILPSSFRSRQAVLKWLS